MDQQQDRLQAVAQVVVQWVWILLDFQRILWVRNRIVFEFMQWWMCSRFIKKCICLILVKDIMDQKQDCQQAVALMVVQQVKICF